MSTTVTYKGQTLTTVENQTKTLNTAGTWVEGDFTLTDVTQGGGGDELLYKFINGNIEASDIDWSKITTLRNGQFYAQKSLTTIPNPTISTVFASSFEQCSGLTTAEITATSMLIGYGDYAFSKCTNLETATIHFTYNGNGIISFSGLRFFQGCTKLHTVILDNVGDNNGMNYSAQWMFSDDSALRTLVLKSPKFVNLTSGTNTYAWGGIYDNPAESTIYVPSDLVSTYQTATNWSTLYSRGVTFAPIEGSIYDD